MLNDLNPKDYRNIYIVCGFTDMRGGINTLSSIIEGCYKMNAFIGKTLFLFCGRKANTIKGLIWEGDGFLMLTKRLERGRYTWTRTSEEVRAMSSEQFRWLMHGFPSVHQFRLLILNTSRKYHIFIVQKIEIFLPFLSSFKCSLYSLER